MDKKDFNFIKVKKTLRELKVIHNELKIVQSQYRKNIAEGLEIGDRNMKIKAATLDAYTLLSADIEEFKREFGPNFIDVFNGRRKEENEIVRQIRIKNSEIAKNAESMMPLVKRFEELEKTLNDQLQESFKAVLPNKFDVTLINQDGIVRKKELTLDEMCDAIVDEETQLVHPERLKAKVEED